MKTALIDRLARKERLKPDELRRLVRTGRVVLLRSKRRKIEPLAVGKGTTVKVNANIGTSPDRFDLAFELEKLKVAVEVGADTIMDLSVGGDIDEVRRAVIDESPVPVGTVPVYQVALDARRKNRSFVQTRPKDMLAGVEKHLADGVDFITVHCGVTSRNVEILRNGKRVCGIVSRGGSMMAGWMNHQGRENPLYEYYDDLLALAKHYGACLSLGDGLRPGGACRRDRRGADCRVDDDRRAGAEGAGGGRPGYGGGPGARPARPDRGERPA